MQTNISPLDVHNIINQILRQILTACGYMWFWLYHCNHVEPPSGLCFGPKISKTKEVLYVLLRFCLLLFWDVSEKMIFAAGVFTQKLCILQVQILLQSNFSLSKWQFLKVQRRICLWKRLKRLKCRVILHVLCDRPHCPLF